MKFKTKCYAHQTEAFEASKDQTCFAFLLDMGTGKTKICLDNIAYQYQSRLIERAVIVAPKGVYLNWIGEIDTHLACAADVGYWKANLKSKEKEKLELLLRSEGRLKILLVNVEAFSTGRVMDYVKSFLDAGGEASFCIDEATKIKNITANRTKNIIKISRTARYRRILTGTPVTNSPLDLYAMFYFLDSRILGFNSFYAFRNTFAITKQQDLANGRRFDVVVGYRNLESLKEKMKPFSFRKLRSECVDLPDKVYMTRLIELTDEQQKIYSAMKNTMMAEMGGKEVAVTMAISKLMKLHQISCGFMNDTKGSAIELEGANPRLEALMDILEEESQKVIIYANYRHNIEEVYEAVKEKYGKESVVHYYGDTSSDDMEYAKKEFQDPGSMVRYFVGNPSKAGYGLTLTEAGHVIFYSNDYDIEKRQQAEDRAHRIGQTKTVIYTDIIARGTVDQVITNSLKSKVKIQDLILGGKWNDIFTP
jgi:SNF2 family DNA or RNA helicase